MLTVAHFNVEFPPTDLSPGELQIVINVSQKCVGVRFPTVIVRIMCCPDSRFWSPGFSPSWARGFVLCPWARNCTFTVNFLSTLQYIHVKVLGNYQPSVNTATKTKIHRKSMSTVVPVIA